MGMIVAVDDSEAVLGTLGRFFTVERHTSHLFTNGFEALEFLKTTMPDLIVLDISMPKMDGITLCKNIRSQPRLASVPMLFLTAFQTPEDAVVGLNAGADEYIRKPFDLSEFRARIRALLRRSHMAGDRYKVATGARLVYHELALDPMIFTAYINQTVVQLTNVECRFLQQLMENAQRVVPSEELLQTIWNLPTNRKNSALLRSHARNLREKLQAVNGTDYIKNRFGLGYQINSHTFDEK